MAVVPWLFPTQSLLLQQATQTCSDGQASFQKNEQSLSRFQGLQSGTPLGPASCNSSPRSRAEDTASPLRRRGCEVPSESILTAPSGATSANHLPLGLALCHCHTEASCAPRCHPSSPQGLRTDGHTHRRLSSVSSNCFRQKRLTLSSERELCTSHLSGVICEKQMFGIITYFSQNQGQFRFLRLFSETCIVLTEFGLDPEMGICVYSFTAFDREVLKVASALSLTHISHFQIILIHKRCWKHALGGWETFE